MPKGLPEITSELSLSDTMVLGRPCSLTTPSKKILATLEASEVQEQGKKLVILEK